MRVEVLDGSVGDVGRGRTRLASSRRHWRLARRCPKLRGATGFRRAWSSPGGGNRERTMSRQWWCRALPPKNLRGTDRTCRFDEERAAAGCGRPKRRDRDQSRRWSARAGRCKRRCGCAGPYSRRSGTTMISIPGNVRVWLATGHTDMRRGFRSLGADGAGRAEARSSLMCRARLCGGGGVTTARAGRAAISPPHNISCLSCGPGITLRRHAGIS